jgi:hypothetical protein
MAEKIRTFAHARSVALYYCADAKMPSPIFVCIISPGDSPGNGSRENSEN